MVGISPVLSELLQQTQNRKLPCAFTRTESVSPFTLWGPCESSSLDVWILKTPTTSQGEIAAENTGEVHKRPHHSGMHDMKNKWHLNNDCHAPGSGLSPVHILDDLVLITTLGSVSLLFSFDRYWNCALERLNDSSKFVEMDLVFKLKPAWVYAKPMIFLFLNTIEPSL